MGLSGTSPRLDAGGSSSRRCPIGLRIAYVTDADEKKTRFPCPIRLGHVCIADAREKKPRFACPDRAIAFPRL